MTLTTKQQAFVEHYLRSWNASQAARDAGYSEKSARLIGSENLTKPDIQAAIEARLAELKMSADEVLARLADQARGSMADFLRVDEEEITLSWSLLKVPTNADGDPDLAGVVMELASQENVQPTDQILRTATVKRAVARLDLLQAGERGKLGLVKKYSLDDKGKVSIELHDAQSALQLLGRHHKLFVDRTELTGKDGNPIEVSDARATLAAKLARRAGADDPKPDPGGS